MQNRLVDPIHIFGSDGRSILESNKLRDRCKLLETQNERLKRLLRARAARDASSETEIKPTLN